MQHPVLDHGYIELVSHMGDDLTVVNAARVSFKKRSELQRYVVGIMPDGEDEYEYWLSQADQKLIKFLAKNGHWSPFSHPQIMLEVSAPMLVINQWRKSKVGMSYTWDEEMEEILAEEEGMPWNEASLRYITPEEFYNPTTWRSAPENKKQGSGPDLDPVLSADFHGTLDGLIRNSLVLYQTMLNDGAAPEQARLVLPAYAMYSSFYWTTSLFGMARFLNLRQAPDAQWEIRQYANAIEPIVRKLFPYSTEALLT